MEEKDPGTVLPTKYLRRMFYYVLLQFYPAQLVSTKSRNRNWDSLLRPLVPSFHFRQCPEVTPWISSFLFAIQSSSSLRFRCLVRANKERAFSFNLLYFRQAKFRSNLWKDAALTNTCSWLKEGRAKKAPSRIAQEFAQGRNAQQKGQIRHWRLRKKIEKRLCMAPC